MTLTERQNDALAELINISFSRTALALSDITGHRVGLDPPEVWVYPISELVPTLGQFVQGEVATVHQILTGPVAGNALLLLDYDGAVTLSRLLVSEESSAQRLDQSAREVLVEVGNILLNACLGTFGNLLQVHFSFAVPRLHLEWLTTLLDSLVIDGDELHYALIASAKFHFRESAVSGYLVLVLGVASLDRLIQVVSQWEVSQLVRGTS